MATGIDSLSGLAPVVGQLQLVIEGASEAIGDIQAALTDMVSTVAQFVQALSPSTMAEFGAAIQSVQATIGTAFIGVVNVFSSVAREIGGVLLPLMQQLEPIFTNIANAIGGAMVSAIRTTVAVLQIFVPLIDIAADAVSTYVDFLNELNTLTVAFIKAIGKFITDLLGSDTGGFKEVFKGLVGVVQQVIKAMVTLVGTIAVAVGAAGAVARFADALSQEAKDREARAGGALAAGTAPQITDVGSIMRQQQLAAFTAQGGGGAREKSDSEYFRSIADDLKRIAGDNRSLKDTLTAWWNENVASSGGLGGKVYTLMVDVAKRIFDSRLFRS